MSSASLNDVVSALNTAFSRSDLSHPLPDDLARTLSAYVSKGKRNEGDGLQDELRTVFRQHVQTQATKLAPFLAALKLLRPAVVAEDHLVEWFRSAVVPFVDQQGFSRAAMADAQEFVVDTVSYDDEAPDARERGRISANLCALLLETYVDRIDPAARHLSVQAQNQAAQQLQSMLIAFARKQPRDFFVSVDDFLMKPDTRLQALGLLAAFLEQQHAHLHLVVHTAVVEHLLKSLMNDTPTIVVSAALRCLIMLLPHIPATVATQLPRLFLIYSRCLCWEKFSASSTKAQRDLVTDDRVRHDSDSEGDIDPDDGADPTWPTLHSLPDVPESSAPELLHYFTYLYGLYPLNFMSYVRKPRKYLKNIDFPGADDFDLDQSVIRSRTEQFQRVHLLHPNFFTTTIEEELSDNRWLKAEPSEVIAECHGLYAGEHLKLDSPGPPPSGKLPALPNFLSLDSAPTPGHPGPVPAASQLDSPTLTPADVEKQVTEQGQKAAIPISDSVYLQRELTLLRNELTFERFLKKQHVAAIGQLKRNHIKAVTVEAETATLINANRVLQKKLGDANNFNEKMQKETVARRNHTKQSEEQLMAKIRSLKAELADQEALQLRLEQLTKDCDLLRNLLVETEARESSKQEQVETFGARLKDSENTRQELSEVQNEVRSLRVQALSASSLQAELDVVKRELESTRFILQHREHELEQSKKAYQTKVADFELRLEEAGHALSPPADQPLSDVTEHLQTMLTESRVNLNQTKKAYAQLLDDYTTLQVKYHEITGSLDSNHTNSPVPTRSYQQQPSYNTDYSNQEGSVRSFSPASSRQAYYTDRGMEQSELFVPQLGYGRVASPVSSLNQSYPPARPMRPEAYQQRSLNANSMARHQGAYINEHSLYPPTAHGAARSNIGSHYDLGMPPMVRKSSKSAFSLNSEDGASIQSKDKIKAKSEVRVYGRGGAQNIKMKSKDGSDKPEKKPGMVKKGLKGLL